MSRSSARRVFLLWLTLAVAFAVACAGPTPPPKTPVSTTMVTPPAPKLSATLAQPPVAAPQQITPVSFSKEILPLFKQQCSLCHIDQSLGGLSLKDHSSLMKGGQSGLEVLIGSPQTSLLMRKLAGDPAVGERMPKGGPYLPEETIRKVADWIRQGAPNN